MPKPDLFTLNISGMNDGNRLEIGVVKTRLRLSSEALDAVLSGNMDDAEKIAKNAFTLDCSQIFKTGGEEAKTVLEDSRRSWGKVLAAALRTKNVDNPGFIVQVASLSIEDLRQLAMCNYISCRLNPSNYEIEKHSRDFVELAERCRLNGIET